VNSFLMNNKKRTRTGLVEVRCGVDGIRGD
jgi:hypothetical protein